MDSEPTWLAIAAGLDLPKEKKGNYKSRTKNKSFQTPINMKQTHIEHNKIISKL